MDDAEARTPERGPRALRVALFTDTLGDVNGVSRFAQNMAAQARATGHDLRVLTSTRRACPAWPNIENLAPLAAWAMPGYADLDIVLPPVGRMIRAAQNLRPDVIHISTPGPVGLAGLVAARLMRVPVLGVYHTDFPAYVERLFDDRAMAWATSRFMRLFYRPFARIFTRSDDYRAALGALGIGPSRLRTLVAGVDTEMFHPRFADPAIWARLTRGPGAAVRVLYVGRVSVEKNLPFLSRVWGRVRSRLAERGLAAELVVVGDGPYRAAMERELRGQEARFLGFRHGAELSAIYASSDLFVFPSVTDTLGQVVMESQASGLPVLVSDRGGPKEVVADGRTGRVLGAGDAQEWADAVTGLCSDAGLRRQMGARAHEAMQGMTIRRSFECFWDAHREVWEERPK